MRIIKVKKLGSSEYFISEDKQYFIKKSNENSEILENEFQNLKKLRERVNIKKLSFIEPISFNKERSMLISKYINAEPIINLIDPSLFFKFGNILKKLHNSGYSLGHLEFNDVLYDKGVFYITDVPYINENPVLVSIIKLLINIQIFKIKRPWLWVKYNNCSDAFLKGYQIELNFEEFKKYYQKGLNLKINLLINRSLRFKIIGLLLKILNKLGLI